MEIFQMSAPVVGGDDAHSEDVRRWLGISTSASGSRAPSVERARGLLPTNHF